MATPKGFVFTEYGCGCGETRPEYFYQKRKTLCKMCFNARLMQKWKENKAKAVTLAGGKCTNCGYDKYIGALEFHHTDTSIKEDNWSKKWTLSEAKIKLALIGTILLCANCHREEHEKLRIG